MDSCRDLGPPTTHDYLSRLALPQGTKETRTQRTAGSLRTRSHLPETAVIQPSGQPIQESRRSPCGRADQARPRTIGAAPEKVHRASAAKLQDHPHQQRLVRRHPLPVLGDLQVQQTIQQGMGHAPCPSHQNSLINPTNRPPGTCATAPPLSTGLSLLGLPLVLDRI